MLPIWKVLSSMRSRHSGYTVTFTTAATTTSDKREYSAILGDIRVNELGSILASSWRSALILNRTHRVTISQRLLGATDTLPDVETDQP
jgi:hypothetical protein